MSFLPMFLGGPAPGSTTAADVLRRAMKLIGVLAAGETLSAEDQEDGIDELNLMLGSWANEQLMVFGVRRSTYALVPMLSPHTIGASGTFVTDRPLRIDGAGVILQGTNTELPLDVLSDAQYRQIIDKTLVSTFPTRMWMEETYPNANLWFWPVPTTAATLVLYARSKLSALSAADVVSLPEGYEDAMGYALALRLAPMFGKQPSEALVQNAMDSLAAIRRTNQPDEVSELDAGLLGRRVFNIHTG